MRHAGLCGLARLGDRDAETSLIRGIPMIGGREDFSERASHPSGKLELKIPDETGSELMRFVAAHTALVDTENDSWKFRTGKESLVPYGGNEADEWVGYLNEGEAGHIGVSSYRVGQGCHGIYVQNWRWKSTMAVCLLDKSLLHHVSANKEQE